MKTRPINSWYLKMNLTLVIVMMFLITVIFVKHVSGQGVGEVKMKVKEINSAEIAGTKISHDSKDKWICSISPNCHR